MVSEYAGRIPCSWENLKQFLRIGKVPEAEGNLTVRSLKACCLEEILSKKDKNEIGQALNCQIQVLAELAGGLKFGKPSAGIFHELEQWELEITRMMEAAALPS